MVVVHPHIQRISGFPAKPLWDKKQLENMDNLPIVTSDGFTPGI